MRSWVAQARKGLVELCVLAVLRNGEAYGYEILQKLKCADSLAITESTVYPLLSRLTSEGWLRVRTRASPTGPPRRYYRLTRIGEMKLKEMESYWLDLRDSIDGLIDGEM